MSVVQHTSRETPTEFRVKLMVQARRQNKITDKQKTGKGTMAIGPV